MRPLLTIIACLSFSMLSVSQAYYYISSINPGHNPGQLNNDDEYPLGQGLPGGWSTILGAANPSGTYSAVQSIPFVFTFAGDTVSQYKVSNSGILTFAVGTSVSPGSANSALPSALVPDSSVVIWGINGSGSNDIILKKTFGAAPNRQLWIHFSSYGLGAYYTYWSIVLEESSNRIYIVDQRHQGGISGGLTLGVQLDSTDAMQVSGSPNAPIYAGTSPGPGDNSYHEFAYGIHPDYDVSAVALNMPGFPNMSSAPLTVGGTFKNRGTQTVTSLTLNYSINGGPVVDANLSGLSIPTGSKVDLVHPAVWSPAQPGDYTVELWVSDINGNVNENSFDYLIQADLVVSDPKVNIIDSFVIGHRATQLGSVGNGLDFPRDLDFHSDYDRMELWVVNRKTEGSGGSATIYSNAGSPIQSFVTKIDGNAWHFMSLPTGIAFSDNGNFATSPGVYDANHGSGTPFTGPTLWSSDPAIYAQPSGGNGSHLDMLHVSPYSMGIAWEVDNAFWVFDANLNDIVRYDFVDDHGPGNDDHSDGRILRYPVPVSRINPDIPCHLALDKATNWLYIVDGGSKRILRLDINSGTKGSVPSFGPFESVTEYRNMVDITWETVVTEGLVEPAGIDVIDDRMIVSDHSNGDIIVYDISSIPAIELGRIRTWEHGIMGIVIAPDGNIWYVNGSKNSVVKLEPGPPSGITGGDHLSWHLFPNPTSGIVNVRLSNESSNAILTVDDLLGNRMTEQVVSSTQAEIVDMTGWPSGTYVVTVKTDGGNDVRKVTLVR